MTGHEFHMHSMGILGAGPKLAIRAGMFFGISTRSIFRMWSDKQSVPYTIEATVALAEQVIRLGKVPVGIPKMIHTGINTLVLPT